MAIVQRVSSSLRLCGTLLALLCACVVAHAGDFQVDMATYLGGASGAEDWSAVDVAPDGAIVVAGTMPEGNLPDAKAQEVLGGGYGVVIRIDGKTLKPLTITRLGDYIEDMQVGEDGAIAVTGSFGVAVLEPDAAKVRWRDNTIIRGAKAAAFRNQTPPFRNDHYTRRVARIAIGTDGTVASMQNDEKAWSGDMKGHLYVWDKDGKRLCDVPLTKVKYPEDVCVDAKHGLAIVGGWNTYAADSKYMKNHPIHMPWMAAYTYAGEQKWLDYDFTAEASYAENTFADSRIQRIIIGRDGFLYLGGYIHGGDYVWHHDPSDVKKRVQVDVGYDMYSIAARMGKGIDQSYFAKFDPETGKILQGQVLVTRVQPNGGGVPAQIQIKGMQADEKGNLYLSGYCEKYIKERDTQKINGVQVGEYYKPEPFVMVTTPDFKSRKVWTVFSKHCEAASWGIGVRDGRAALVAELYEGELITTDNALRKDPVGSPIDGYLVTWKMDEDVKPAQ